MNKFFIIKLIVVVLAFFILHGQALPSIKNQRPFQKTGEELKFSVKYLGITGGYATMKATPIPNKNVMKFEVRAYTIKWVENIFRLRLYMASYSDAKDFQTIQYSESRQENQRYYYNVQRFFKDKNYYVFSEKRNLDEEKIVQVNYTNDGGMSVLGTFHFGRTTDLEVGKTYHSTCFFRDGDPRPIGVKVLRKETIDTLWGTKKTVVITPEMDFQGFLSDQKKMEIFISDDEYKIPLHVDTILKFGTIKAELIEGYPEEKINN